MPDPLLLDTAGAAAVLCVSPSYLENLRTAGGGPDYVKLPGRGRHHWVVRYTPEALRAWIEAQRSLNSTQEGA